MVLRIQVLTVLAVVTALAFPSAADGVDKAPLPDLDGDGYSDVYEIAASSDPLNPLSTPIDRDADGLPNADETCSNPDKPDTDRDGFLDGEEVAVNSDPCAFYCRPIDLDCDRMWDDWERAQFGDLSAMPDDDPDGDTMRNLREFFNRANPHVADTDGDGLWDGHEEDIYQTRPTVADTDRDGYSDGIEVGAGSDPLKACSVPGDRDCDGFADDDEIAAGSNPDDYNSDPADQDGDGIPWLLEQVVSVDGDRTEVCRDPVGGLKDKRFDFLRTHVMCELDEVPVLHPLALRGVAVYNPVLLFSGPSDPIAGRQDSESVILDIHVEGDQTVFHIGELENPTSYQYADRLLQRSVDRTFAIPVGSDALPLPASFQVPQEPGRFSMRDRDADGMRATYGFYSIWTIDEAGAITKGERQWGQVSGPDIDDSP